MTTLHEVLVVAFSLRAGAIDVIGVLKTADKNTDQQQRDQPLPNSVDLIFIVSSHALLYRLTTRRFLLQFETL